MKTKKLRRLKRALYRVKGVFAGNPVLVYGLGLPFAVFASTSLKNAVALSIALLVSNIPTLLMASLLSKSKAAVPAGVKLASYTLLSAFLLIPSSKLIAPLSPYIFDSLGIYFPLIAVNTVLLHQAKVMPADEKPLTTVLYAFFNVLGFAIVMCLMGAVRELFGRGSLWGISMDFVKIRMGGLLIPFSGFILLGFLCAAYKGASRMIKKSFLRADLRAAKR